MSLADVSHLGPPFERVDDPRVPEPEGLQVPKQANRGTLIATCPNAGEHWRLDKGQLCAVCGGAP